MARVEVASVADAERRLPVLLQFHIGQGAFVSEKRRMIATGRSLVPLGITKPRVIRDPVTKIGQLTFMRYPNVGIAEIQRVDKGFELILPTRREMETAVEREESGFVLRAEQAFLHSARGVLAKSSIIQNALNPIKEILVALNELDSVSMSQLDHQKRYVSLLRGLGYVDEEAGKLHRGPMFEKFRSPRGAIESNQMLGDIISQGYANLSGPLRIRHITSFVRTANAYFLPSHEAGRRLSYRIEDFATNVHRVYRGYRPSSVKLLNHIDDLTNIGVFERDGEFRTANPTMWESFEQSAPAIS